MSNLPRLFLCWNALSLPAFYIFFKVLNFFFADRPIPENQIIAVSMLFAVYFMLLFAATWLGGQQTWKSRTTGLGIWLIAFLFLVLYGYELIYSWLPALGINFHNPNKSFRIIEFRKRLTTGFLVTWIIASAMVFAVRYFSNKKRLNLKKEKLKQLNNDISLLKSQLNAKHLCPHFIEGVIAITMGKMATDKQEDNLDNLLKLASVMHHAIEMQETESSIPINKEWEQVLNLLDLASLSQKEAIEKISLPPSLQDIRIPIGLFLTPIENAIKYGDVLKRSSFSMRFIIDQDKWIFRVVNDIIHAKRDSIRSQKTGYKLLSKRIANGNWPIKIEREENQTQYLVSISGPIN